MALDFGGFEALTLDCVGLILDFGGFRALALDFDGFQALTWKTLALGLEVFDFGLGGFWLWAWRLLALGLEVLALGLEDFDFMLEFPGWDWLRKDTGDTIRVTNTVTWGSTTCNLCGLYVDYSHMAPCSHTLTQGAPTCMPIFQHTSLSIMVSRHLLKFNTHHLPLLHLLILSHPWVMGCNVLYCGTSSR